MFNNGILINEMIMVFLFIFSIGGSVFSFFKGLAGQKAITKEAIEPVLEKMREHLICKCYALYTYLLTGHFHSIIHL